MYARTLKTTSYVVALAAALAGGRAALAGGPSVKELTQMVSDAQAKLAAVESAIVSLDSQIEAERMHILQLQDAFNKTGDRAIYAKIQLLLDDLYGLVGQRADAVRSADALRVEITKLEAQLAAAQSDAGSVNRTPRVKKFQPSPVPAVPVKRASRQTATSDSTRVDTKPMTVTPIFVKAIEADAVPVSTKK